MRIPSLLFAGLLAGPAPAFTLGNPVHFWLATYDCEQGDDQACLHMMQETEWPPTIVNKAKAKQALPQLKDACGPSDAEACARFAATLLSVSRDNAPEAHELLAQSCDAGFGWSCLKVSYPVDIISADGYYGDVYQAGLVYYDALAQSCRTGDTRACASQSELSLAVHYVELDSAEAKEVWYHQLVPLCEQDVARACAQLGFILGSEDFEPLSPGTDIGNLDLAIQASVKACALGNPRGCDNAAFDLEAESVERAFGYFRQACVLGDFAACSILSTEPIWSASSAADEMAEACQLGDVSACFARLVADAPIPATLRDATSDLGRNQVLAYADHLERLCMQGSAPACGLAADALFDATEFNPKGARLAFAGCGDAEQYGSDPHACTVLEAYQAVSPVQ